MPGKRRWTWRVAVLLVAMLLPVGQLAGIPIQQASAQDSGMLELSGWGFNEYEDGAWFDWDIFYEDGPYDLFVRLYRMPSLESVPEANASLTQSDSQARAEVELPPGSYKIVLELVIDEEVAVQDEQYFTLTGVPLNVYLFGADVDTMMELYSYWNEYDMPLVSYDSFGGFVRYTFEVYRDSCYELTSPSHSSFGAETVCAYDQYDYVYHLVQPNFEVDLAEYDIIAEDGFASGYIRFYGYEDLYQLVFVDQNGDVIEACVEEFWGDPGNDYGTTVNFQCNLPPEARSLRIEAVADGFSFPTNVVLHLDDIDLPGQISAEDQDTGMDRVELAVHFKDSADAQNLALYKVYTANPYLSRYVPAGQGSYAFAMEAMESIPGDRLNIVMVGNDGHEYVKRAAVPLKDNISAMFGDMEFACENYSGVNTASYQFDPSSYYCEYFDLFEDDGIDVVPEDADFANGIIGWTLPDTGDYRLAGYDLYYADEDREIIQGDVRINSPDLYGTGSLAHTLSNVPQGAAYMAVVTLLYDWNEDEGDMDANYYFAPPFFIPIGEEQPPQEEEPDELVQGSELIPLEDGSYGYIPKGMTAGMVMDKFQVAAGAEMMIQNGNNKPGLFDPVTPGSILIVTLGERREEIRLRFLSELLRPSGTEPVTAAHVTVFVIAQLAAADPVDLTGDGIFNQDDVRLLLGEL